MPANAGIHAEPLYICVYAYIVLCCCQGLSFAVGRGHSRKRPPCSSAVFKVFEVLQCCRAVVLQCCRAVVLFCFRDMEPQGKYAAQIKSSKLFY